MPNESVREKIVAILNKVYFTGFASAKGWDCDDEQSISEQDALTAILKIISEALPEEANYSEENESGIVFHGKSWNACLSETRKRLGVGE